MKHSLHLLLFCLTAVVLTTACKSDLENWEQPYELAYSYDTTQPISVGVSAKFIDLSLGVDSRKWTFQDATPSTSSLAEANVVFNSKGEKTITLVINYLNGTTETKDFVIRVHDPLRAEISCETLTPKGCVKLNLATEFNLSSVVGDPTSYEWTFEGGTPTTSTLAKPFVTWDVQNTSGAKVTCKISRSEDNMSTTLEREFIVGNYPLLHGIADKEYDPWRFEASSIGKWELYNLVDQCNDLSKSTKVVEDGANNTQKALQINATNNVTYSLNTRDSWVTNAWLEPGKRYEITFWHKTNATPNTFIVLLFIYNFLPDWSSNDVLPTGRADKDWSIYFPDSEFEYQDEEMQALWSNVDFDLAALGASGVLPGTSSLMPTSSWNKVSLEFTASTARSYQTLMNSYPSFLIMSDAVDISWTIDEIEINLIEE